MRNVVILRGILLGLVVLVLGAGPASAHAALVGTDPEDGSSLSAAPTSIAFTFNENISSRAEVAVAAPDGTQLKVTAIKGVDNVVTATLADVGQRGTYSASYRVVSADGHPVAGTITYDVTTGRTVDQVAPPERKTFLHRHSSHFFWGILAAVVAIVLLLAPLRRRHDADSA